MPIHEMSPEEAAAKLDDLRCIDVRDPHEFHGPLGYIDGAESYPLDTLPGSMLRGNRNDKLLVISRSGKRSRAACGRLHALGYLDVFDLEGGMIAWNREGFQVFRTELKSLPELLGSIEAYVAQVTPCERTAAKELVARILGEAGSSTDAPSAAAVDRLLYELSEQFRSDRSIPTPPPDLGLVLNAFQRDLAVL